MIIMMKQFIVRWRYSPVLDPDRFCRAHGGATRLSALIDPCTLLHGDEGVDERQTRGGDGA